MSEEDKMEFDERVLSKMEQFVPYLNTMTCARRNLLEDTLRDYCHAAVQLDDINDDIRETGTTIVNVQGNTVKNPDLTTQHSLRCEKNALLPKLLKYLPEETEEDALGSFMAG